MQTKRPAEEGSPRTETPESPVQHPAVPRSAESPLETPEEPLTREQFIARLESQRGYTTFYQTTEVRGK